MRRALAGLLMILSRGLLSIAADLLQEQPLDPDW